MPSAKSKYKNISLPEPLLERIKKFIEAHPEMGYTSISEFVRHATIEKLDNYNA